jgi:hypothetical protein
MSIRLRCIKHFSDAFWSYYDRTENADPIVFRHGIKEIMTAIDAALDLEQPIPASVLPRLEVAGGRALPEEE